MSREERPLNWELVDGVHVVNLPRDLFDILEIALAKEGWLEFIEREKPSKLVFNFDHVSYCGSEAVGNLVLAGKRVRQHGGDIKLCSMHQRVREIFEICRLIPHVFTVYPSTAEAIEAFESD